MRTPRIPYAQLMIGQCGHVVSAWPAVRSLSKRKTIVICDTCTLDLERSRSSAEEWADAAGIWIEGRGAILDPEKPRPDWAVEIDADLNVWVGVEDEDQPVKPERKPRKKKESVKRSDGMVRQDGLW